MTNRAWILLFLLCLAVLFPVGFIIGIGLLLMLVVSSLGFMLKGLAPDE